MSCSLSDIVVLCPENNSTCPAVEASVQASSDHVLLSVHSLDFSKLPAAADGGDDVITVTSSAQTNTTSWNAQVGTFMAALLTSDVDIRIVKKGRGGCPARRKSRSMTSAVAPLLTYDLLCSKYFWLEFYIVGPWVNSSRWGVFSPLDLCKFTSICRSARLPETE